jgi:hypothetical protein
MRFESATVPAAVMPDRSVDDGIMINLPLFRNTEWEGFIKPGQVRRPARQNQPFKAFGKKSAG